MPSRAYRRNVEAVGVLASPEELQVVRVVVEAMRVIIDA